MRYRFSAVAAIIALSLAFRSPAELLLGPEAPQFSITPPGFSLDSMVKNMERVQAAEGDSRGTSSRSRNQRQLHVLSDSVILERAVVVSTAMTLPRDSAGFLFVSRCMLMVDPENLPQNARASVDSAAKRWTPVSIMLTNWSAMISTTVEDALRKAGVLAVVCRTKTELPVLEKLPPLSKS